MTLLERAADAGSRYGERFIHQKQGGAISPEDAQELSELLAVFRLRDMGGFALHEALQAGLADGEDAIRLSPRDMTALSLHGDMLGFDVVPLQLDTPTIDTSTTEVIS